MSLEKVQTEATSSVPHSQVRVKEEEDGEYKARQLHQINVKFSNTGDYTTLDYEQHWRVLEAIKPLLKDENIIIQLGKEDKGFAIATHFPCSCIDPGERLVIFSEIKKVEEAENQPGTVYSRDRYSVFYIDTQGGKNTKSKQLFRNNALKKFKYVCVYAEKGLTVAEAMKRDGRFIDDLGDFTLSDNADNSDITKCTRPVDNLDKKKFKVCLQRTGRANYEKQRENPGASNISQQKCDTVAVLDVHQRGISVSTAVKKSDSSDNTEEIYEILRQQFPDLRKLMESRFPKDSYQETLNLRKEDFGKIQQSFSEVHRVRKLLKLAKSVCKVIVRNVIHGTGFVLFDNFILTNAHLFKDHIKGERLTEDIHVSVLFNYEDPDQHKNYSEFQLAHPNIYYSEGMLDYAVLELNAEGQKHNQTTQTETIKVPPGLLKEFGPMPETGEACIIGHPGGEVKQMDPTCIIEKERRNQAVSDHLHPYKDSIFILQSISHLIKEQGIENIMKGGNKAEKVVTYDTFMYHGSSGSPVFDGQCKVFGLHTGGFTYGFQKQKKSVIEFAQPLLTIFEDFVRKLEESGKFELLKRVEKEAKNIRHQKKGTQGN